LISDTKQKSLRKLYTRDFMATSVFGRRLRCSLDGLIHSYFSATKRHAGR
jgi:hypothetical protein